MKKITTAFLIITASILMTGCIDNNAVKELNALAGEYLQHGEPQKAICRLESSIDLDGGVFESRYNLGVAYIEIRDFAKAKEQLQEALKLHPESANAYYSLGVAQEGMAFSIINKETEEIESENETEEIKEEITTLSNEETVLIQELIQNAIQSYQTYLTKKPDSEDREEIERQITSLQGTLVKYTPVAQ